MPAPPIALDEASFDALGNPTRRVIMRMLAESPRSVQEIADALPVSRPAVSKHLRILEGAALVRSEPAGRKNIIHLDKGGFDAARAWLDAFWDDALARFVLVAENTEEDPR